MEFDVVDFIKYLKNKILFALAVIIVKQARSEGISAKQYAKQIQERYFEENQNKMDQDILQRYLRNCQEEFLQKLRKSIPSQSIPCNIIEDEEDINGFGGGSLDWFERPSPSCSNIINKNDYSKLQIRSIGADIVSEVCAIKHLNFIASLIKLHNESEGKSHISSDLLYSLLHDELEHQQNYDRECSEDSGIGSSEHYSEDNINYVSCDTVKYVLQSSNSQQVLLNSMKFVLEHVKRELSMNIRRVFFNWKGSLVEYTFKILRECSHKNVECKDMLLNLIFNLLEGMWTDKSLSQHFEWEMRIHIVNTLIGDYEDCYEVLQYISERVDYIIWQIGDKGNFVPLMMEKLCLLLDQYSKVCHQFRKLQFPDDNNSFKPVEEKEGNVTQLWQTRWCKQSVSETKRVSLSSIEEDQIQVLERLIILVSNRYPIVACLAKESLKYALQLVSNEESHIYTNNDLEFLSD